MTQETTDVTRLYEALLGHWNSRSAGGFAGLFAENGNVIGFDGSQLNGRAEIASALGQVFADHATPAYVAVVREVRFPAAGVAVLRAVAGMVPAGQRDLDPALNAIQTMVAARQGERWQIEVFHTTPAAFHGRPELSASLTAELREAVVSAQGLGRTG